MTRRQRHGWSTFKEPPPPHQRRMHSERAFQDFDTRWMENTRTCRASMELVAGMEMHGVAWRVQTASEWHGHGMPGPKRHGMPG